MTPAKPYTPNDLAERWDCSDETIRQMAKRGELRYFRVGRMIRIPIDAVEEYESCQISSSEDCVADSASTGQMRTESEPVISLTHAPQRKQKRKQ